MQGQWDNLGDLSPDHYDPSGIDPSTMRDLKDPRQMAGPVPQYHQDGMRGMENGNGQHPSVEQTVNFPQGNPRPRNISAPPNPQMWDNLGALAEEAASEPWGGVEASYVQPMQNALQRRRPAPPRPAMMEKGKASLLIVGAALAAGLGVWWWNNHR